MVNQNCSTSSQDADGQHTGEAADSSAPADSDVTVDGTVSSERPVASPENSPPDVEGVQEKVDPAGQLATSENDKNDS